MTDRPVLRAVGYILGAGFAGVSVVANARYASAQGAESIDAWLYIASSVGADGLKIILPIFAGLLWRAHKWLACGASMFWILCAFWSGLSVVGWASTSAGTVVSEKDNVQTRYDRAVEASSKAEADLAAVAAHRPLEVVIQLKAAAQAAVPQNRWRLSKECTDITTDASRDACKDFMALGVEEATAREADKLDGIARAARDKLDHTQMPKGSADPQAETAKAALHYIGYEVKREQARSLLNVFAVLLIELAASTLITLTLVATGDGDTASGRRVKGAQSAARDEAASSAAARGGKTALQNNDITKNNGASLDPITAVEKPRKSNDAKAVVAVWAASRLSAVAGASVACGEAFKDFETWAPQNGAPRLDPVKFGVAAAAIVNDLGGEKVKRRDARYFEGVALIEGTVQ